MVILFSPGGRYLFSTASRADCIAVARQSISISASCFTGVDEYVGDSEAGLLHAEPHLDGALPEISVDHIIGGHPLMGLTASSVAKDIFVTRTSTEWRSAAFVIRFGFTNTRESCPFMPGSPSSGSSGPECIRPLPFKSAPLRCPMHRG